MEPTTIFFIIWAFILIAIALFAGRTAFQRNRWKKEAWEWQDKAIQLEKIVEDCKDRDYSTRQKLTQSENELKTLRMGYDKAVQEMKDAAVRAEADWARQEEKLHKMADHVSNLTSSSESVIKRNEYLEKRNTSLTRELRSLKGKPGPVKAAAKPKSRPAKKSK